MDELLKQIVKFLLQYANVVVGVCATFILEFLKRNFIEKIVALTGQVKKILYPAMAILLSIGVAQIIKVLRPIIEKLAPTYLIYFPMITNIWIVGGATGILIALGYTYMTKDLPKNP